MDRDRGPVKEIERYTFDPSFLVVDKGGQVVLKIHVLKGDYYLVAIPAFGVPNTMIVRGEEKTITFVADKAGVFEIACINHKDANTKGPMVGYISVFDKAVIKVSP